ncbi:MAG: 30S ribosomal protein S6 [Pseudomonadota bacterium]
MPLYEHVFLARQDVSGQQVDALVEHFKSVIEDHEGRVGKIENWGLKTLTFRINKNRKAHYALMNIEASPAAMAEMERQMRLHEDILRYMTIRVEEHEEGPSAILRRNERDDRRGRGGDRGDRGPRPPRGDRPGGDRPPRTESAPAGDA